MLPSLVSMPQLVAEDAEKDHFYSILDIHLQSIHHGDNIIPLGGFNARLDMNMKSGLTSLENMALAEQMKMVSGFSLSAQKTSSL